MKTIKALFFTSKKKVLIKDKKNNEDSSISKKTTLENNNNNVILSKISKESNNSTGGGTTAAAAAGNTYDLNTSRTRRESLTQSEIQTKLSTNSIAIRDKLLTDLRNQAGEMQSISRKESFNGESLRFLTRLMENNKKWARKCVENDADYFIRNKETQRPEYLWIGCSDSRMPANQIVGVQPGEMMVHRNIANLVHLDDPNCLSVIQHSVDNLKVQHIIVCGHYRCGGCRLALEKAPEEETNDNNPVTKTPLEYWISPIRELCKFHKEDIDALPDEESRWKFVCEESVKKQVMMLEQLSIVKEAWKRKQPLALHGWIYDITDGTIKDLQVTNDVCFFPTS